MRDGRLGQDAVAKIKDEGARCESLERQVHRTVKRGTAGKKD